MLKNKTTFGLFPYYMHSTVQYFPPPKSIRPSVPTLSLSLSEWSLFSLSLFFPPPTMHTLTQSHQRLSSVCSGASYSQDLRIYRDRELQRRRRSGGGSISTGSRRSLAGYIFFLTVQYCCYTCPLMEEASTLYRKPVVWCAALCRKLSSWKYEWVEEN